MEYRQQSARLPKSAEEKERWRRVIVVLEHCPLATVSTDKGFELLSEKHRGYHARRQQDPAEWRPDVVHQCLLHLLDSPLNRAGHLQVFLRTRKGVCIAVDPRLRVPRHWRLFEKMMVRCLYKMRVRASTGYLTLVRVVKNPITDHLPANTRFIRVEKDGERIDLDAFCATCGHADAAHATAAADSPVGDATVGVLSAGSHFAASLLQSVEDKQYKPFAFVIGGMSKGNVDAPYAPVGSVESIRLGDRGMTAAAVCSTILHTFEELWLSNGETHRSGFGAELR